MLPPALLPYLAGAGAILCWASLATAVGENLRTLAPETVLFWGLLTAGLSLSIWEMARGGLRAFSGPLSWPGWRVAAFGIYGIWGYHTLLVLAFAHAPHLEANILNYAWTLGIVVLGAMLPGHRFTPRIALGAMLGFTGVVLVIGGEGWLHGSPLSAFRVGGNGRWLGFALALSAALTWSSFTVWLGRVVPAGQNRMALFCLLAAAAAFLFALARGAPLALPWPAVPGVIYLGLVPLALSFALWERAAQGCHVQVLGLMSFFTPVLSTLLLSAVSGRPAGAVLYAGLALILGGSLLGGRALVLPPSPSSAP